MAESSADLSFAVEVHPANWRFPAGKSWIAGWIRPPDGHVITDVRARIHHRVILGLAGLPDPQGAGFSFLLAPQPDATQLQLEARDQSGRWREFFQTKITAATAAPAPPPRPALDQSLNQLIATLLKRQARFPDRTWADLADELVAAWVAEPLSAHPNPPSVGALEEPRDLGRLRYGRLSVTGWLVHPPAKINRLWAVIDPLPATLLPLGLTRPDITATFPALGGHLNSAFAGAVPLPPDLATPVLLKVFAELETGERPLVFAQRFAPQFHAGDNQIPPLVPGSAYARALGALLRAAGRYAMPRRNLVRLARTAWAGYRSMPVYRPMGSRPPAEKIQLRANRAAARGALAGANSADNRAPDALSSPRPACTAIAPADDMAIPDASHYFQIGREALRLVHEASLLAGTGRIEAVLDLPCGFGRVARWLRTAYPAAHLAVSDTQAHGVQFCREELGATGVIAHGDGRHWADLPGPYDIIWCGSLLTHFDWVEWVSHLQRFAARLSPQGVLIFTTHGQHALGLLQSGEKDYGLPPAAVARLGTAAVTEGFSYADYPETPGYGISISQPGWIRELIARETGLQVLEIREAAWGGHQDVVVCGLRAAGRNSP